MGCAGSTAKPSPNDNVVEPTTRPAKVSEPTVKVCAFVWDCVELGLLLYGIVLNSYGIVLDWVEFVWYCVEFIWDCVE
jgi:hypothetical protein